MTTSVVSLALAVWLIGVAVGQQEPPAVPGAAYLTAVASGLAVVAIAQVVRSISRSEAQKTQVVDTLREQLDEAHDEIRRLLELLREEHEHD